MSFLRVNDIVFIECVDEYLELEYIQRIDWSAEFLYLNPTQHIWDIFGRENGGVDLRLRILLKLKIALLSKWELLALDFISSLVNSILLQCDSSIGP